MEPLPYLELRVITERVFWYKANGAYAQLVQTKFALVLPDISNITNNIPNKHRQSSLQ